MTDPTEDIRKQMLAEINAVPGSQGVPGSQARAGLGYLRVSPMTSMVIGFSAPLVVVEGSATARRAA